ncbi:hypothetical protein HanLR1_Chr01g0031591 [Helianthus annuus]|nr:hypothetical protein HanHA89_Chr01g0033091 [Helianthus annuus]KAJ0784392.1 hypothetical protein HanLR1_Chr01g0031591 [Helianthus annuus]
MRLRRLNNKKKKSKSILFIYLNSHGGFLAQSLKQIEPSRPNLRSYYIYMSVRTIGQRTHIL